MENTLQRGLASGVMASDFETLDRIRFIWDTLADYDADKVEEALIFLQTRLCELVNAQNADWFGAVRMAAPFSGDPVGGWRSSVIRQLRQNEKFFASVKDTMRNNERGGVNDVVLHIVAKSGNFRACRLCDVMSDEWFKSPSYRHYYLTNSYSDALYIAFPVNEDAESWFGLFHATGQPPFSEEERDTLAYALRGIKWFHRQLLLSHGLLVAGTPLTPMERLVLQGLLIGFSENEIAAIQELSYRITHEYVITIFQKFGVNNPAALRALWMGQAP